MINIANKAYDGRDFMNDFKSVLDDIPVEVIQDEEDLIYALTTGLETNYPKAYQYFKSRKKDLIAPVLGALKEYADSHKKRFKYNKNNGDYMSYFKDKLNEWGVTSPSDLSDSQKSKFFKEVKAGK